MNTPAKTPIAAYTETISNSLELHWFHERRIFIFSLQDISRDTIDQWTILLATFKDEWPLDQPFLTMADFSHVKNFTLTPYIRAKIEPIMQSHADKAGRTAVVVPKIFTAQAVEMFMLSSPIRQEHRQRQLFYTVAEGLSWLEEGLN